MINRCQDCDRQLATQADHDTTKEGEGQHLCWRDWGDRSCQNPPAAWRYRALVADAALAARDRSIDAMTARIAELSAEIAERDIAVQSLTTREEELCRKVNHLLGTDLGHRATIAESNLARVTTERDKLRAQLNQSVEREAYNHRANEELAELIVLLVERDDDPRAGMEVADVQIVLAGIAAAHGQDQSALVDAKMKINRARTWRTTGDGHGQHVEKEQG